MAEYRTTGQHWIEPASTRALPDPVELRRMIHSNLEVGYQELRRRQGDVHTPEDTFAMQRALAATRERFTDWAAAFRDGARRIAEMQQEQLIEGVGERIEFGETGTERPTGVPNQGLTVPDPAGDFRLSVDFSTERDFDLDQLIGVVASAHAAGFGDTQYTEGLYELIRGALLNMLELGKFEPQVTKVAAYAKRVARGGDDKLASVVTGAVTSRLAYKGVSVKRSTT